MGGNDLEPRQLTVLAGDVEWMEGLRGMDRHRRDGMTEKMKEDLDQSNIERGRKWENG